MADENPWLSAAPPASMAPAAPVEPAEQAPFAPLVAFAEEPGPPTGPPGPQPFVSPPPAPLPRREPSHQAQVWWLGVHGGAGESTLARLGGGAEAGGAWPVTTSGRAPVVLVARTHYSGLTAARAAATEWASGQVPVTLLGLALVADAPGRRPKALRDLEKLVAGAVPRTWQVPWVEAWRLSEPHSQDMPGALRRMFGQVTALTS
ncbi:hypothetical protein O4J56_17790 [Nocardiopsis sp. RSe5-2]|uniref:Uncharacterized protein n=1 Tax=Nocardiopsis endophytica TaxID=3018445 RepID=A0ABT4U6D5_9ACTN|nr:DUF6668 family protein [Nocardiopsis endophytica]MDA2812500.1 hypothetical protein [Nocardiopsis endophytica]